LAINIIIGDGISVILVEGGGTLKRVGFCVMGNRISTFLCCWHWKTPAILVIYSHVNAPFFLGFGSREQKKLWNVKGATTAGTQLTSTAAIIVNNVTG